MKSKNQEENVYSIPLSRSSTASTQYEQPTTSAPRQSRFSRLAKKLAFPPAEHAPLSERMFQSSSSVASANARAM